MRSDDVKTGIDKAPQRSLLRASGLTDDDMDRPFIGIADSWNNIVPGHIHLNKVVDAVIEGIEEYKGVNIVYSLGNFCFGGNSRPKDMETFIYQHEFIVDPASGKLLESHFNVIPCRITSVADASSNNYQPTPIEDPDGQIRLLKRIEEYSKHLSSPVKLTS